MSENTERLNAIQDRASKVSPGPWDAVTGANTEGTELVTTKEAKAEFLAASLNDDVSRLWLVASPEVIPAATGDGSRAQANAEFIAAAPSDVAFLLDLARRQQAVIEALSQWAGKSKTGYYDEAQDDVVQIIRPALEAKP